MPAAWSVRAVCALVVCAALTGCPASRAPVGEAPDAAGTGSPSAATSAPRSPHGSATPSAGTEAGALTERERRRLVLRDRTPDAQEIIALAKVPTDWTRSGDTVLVSYGLAPASEGPGEAWVQALQLLDRRGRVIGQWAEYGARDYWPVPGGFVGTPWWSTRRAHPVLVRDGMPIPLTEVKGARAARPGEVRFGQGWLLDEDGLTVTREKIDGCRSDSIRIDTRGRIWCLNRPWTELAWSDDGRSWTRHQLSTQYLPYCDAPDGMLEVVGDVVAIGLWRADISVDRGETWSDVDLPLRLTAGPREVGGSGGPRCPRVSPLPDGRLVMEQYGTAIAEDATNTRWAQLRTPPGTTYAGRVEGALLAAPHRHFDDGWLASYDAGATWQPHTVKSLLRQALP